MEESALKSLKIRKMLKELAKLKAEQKEKNKKAGVKDDPSASVLFKKIQRGMDESRIERR